jgi:hypothetical protein
VLVSVPYSAALFLTLQPLYWEQQITFKCDQTAYITQTNIHRGSRWVQIVTPTHMVQINGQTSQFVAATKFGSILSLPNEPTDHALRIIVVLLLLQMYRKHNEECHSTDTSPRITWVGESARNPLHRTLPRAVIWQASGANLCTEEGREEGREGRGCRVVNAVSGISINLKLIRELCSTHRVN